MVFIHGHGIEAHLLGILEHVEVLVVERMPLLRVVQAVGASTHTP